MCVVAISRAGQRGRRANCFGALAENEPGDAENVSNRKIRHYTINFVCRHHLPSIEEAAPRISPGLSQDLSLTTVGPAGTSTSGRSRSVALDPRIKGRANHPR